MKTRFLFPRKWRLGGFIFLFIGIVVIPLIGKYYEDHSISWQNAHPLLSGHKAAVLINDIKNAVTLVSLIVGLFLIGFSKEKVEDERIAQLRLDSLQWAIYFNYVVLLIGVFFMSDWYFSLLVLMLSMFTPLLFFIVRFRWVIYQSNRALKYGE